MSRYGSPTVVGKRDVEKGFAKQGVKPILALKTPAAGRLLKPSAPTPPKTIVGKGVAGQTLRAIKAAPKVMRAGFRQGVSGAAKPTMGLSEATEFSGSKPLQAAGHAGKFAGANRVGLSTGVVAGSVIGGGLARRDVEKSYGDPEDARYYRLGAGSAALAGGGVGALGYAARDARHATRAARAGSPMGVHNLKNVQLFVADKDEIKAKKGTRHQVNLRALEPKAVHRADRLAQHGVAMTRRGALAGLGGLAALGGANALRRRAHERRYD